MIRSIWAIGVMFALRSASALAQGAFPSNPEPEQQEYMIIPGTRLQISEFHLGRKANHLFVKSKCFGTAHVVHIDVGHGIFAQHATASTHANGDTEIRFSTGEHIFLQGFRKLGGYITVNFADGTQWTPDDIKKISTIGSKQNRVLYGTGNDEFYPRGFARTIVAKGNGDEVFYKAGYGRLTIDEDDSDDLVVENFLSLGRGLAPEKTTVSRNRRGDIILSFGHGDVIIMSRAMIRDEKHTHGMQTIQFETGKRWSIGDLRYQLHPDKGGLKVTHPPAPFNFDLDFLDSYSSEGDMFEFSDSHIVDTHEAHVVGVSATGETPASLTTSRLLGFMETGVNEDARGGRGGRISWRFAAPGAFDFLKRGQSATLNYEIAISDRQGGKTTQTVPIVVTNAGKGLIHLGADGLKVNYPVGRGNLEIEGRSDHPVPNTVLAFGPGITPSMVMVRAAAAPQSRSPILDGLQLVVADSGTVSLAEELTDPNKAVPRVTFADGSVWAYERMVAMAALSTVPDSPFNGRLVAVGGIGPDVLDSKGLAHIAQGNGGGDTFVYNRGYGALDIIERDPASQNNQLAFGPGIGPADIKVTMADVGQFILDLGNGDVVTFASSGGERYSDGYQDQHCDCFVPGVLAYIGPSKITFADGTAWTIPDLVARQVPIDGVIHGTAGAVTLDPKGTSGTIESAGEGDRIIYDRGYGAVTINELPHAEHPRNVLVFGPGITASALQVSTRYADMIIALGGNDVITLGRALDYHFAGQPLWGVQVFRFADGSSLSFADMLAKAQPAGKGDSEPKGRH